MKKLFGSGFGRGVTVAVTGRRSTEEFPIDVQVAKAAKLEIAGEVEAISDAEVSRKKSALSRSLPASKGMFGNRDLANERDPRNKPLNGDRTDQATTRSRFFDERRKDKEAGSVFEDEKTNGADASLPKGDHAARKKDPATDRQTAWRQAERDPRFNRRSQAPQPKPGESN